MKTSAALLRGLGARSFSSEGFRHEAHARTLTRVSTPYYLIAHKLLPSKAAKEPETLFRMLSGPDWSTFFAMIGSVLGVPVRGVGVEGVVQGKAVHVRDGVEMLAIYFPEPAGPGEPYFAVLARKQGTTRLRSYVFEKGISEPGEPLRVIMAEWRVEGESSMRIRMDESPDASLEACLMRAASVFLADKGDEAPPPIAALASHVGAAPKTGGGARIAVAVTVGLLLLAIVAAVLLSGGDTHRVG